MYIYTGFCPACPRGAEAPGNPVQTCLQGKEDMSGQPVPSRGGRTKEGTCRVWRETRLRWVD